MFGMVASERPNVPQPNGGVVHFPEGLPGFETFTHFLLLQETELLPIVFLRSLAAPHVCLPVVPVQQVLDEYHLVLSEEDRRILRLDPASEDVLCLVVLHLGDGRKPVTANLLAPIVINVQNWTARQVIQADSPYSSLAEVG